MANINLVIVSLLNSHVNIREW